MAKIGSTARKFTSLFQSQEKQEQMIKTVYVPRPAKNAPKSLMALNSVLGQNGVKLIWLSKEDFEQMKIDTGEHGADIIYKIEIAGKITRLQGIRG
jgi:ethanolamine utilization protein EutQ (cupin superfamily)